MVIFLFTSLAFLFLGTYLWCVVVVTSPIGALVCWNSAIRRARDPVRPALAGAIYWACWFLPWIYFVYRCDGRDVPAGLVKAGHWVMFVAWLMGPVFGGFVMVWSSKGDPYLSDVWIRLWLLVAPFANLAALVGSVLWLANRKKDAPDSDYPDLGGVAPFGCAAVGSAMYLPLVIIASIVG